VSADDQTYTVGDLNRLIRQALSRRFPDDLWVEGEIRGLNRHHRSGHVYFQLADPGAEGRQADALISVALFRSEREVVNRVLKRVGAVRMADGVHIRIRGQLDYYPAGGKLSLKMLGIDPAYTLGRLEAERQRLVDALTAEGLLETNRARPYPLLPLRVGLVTSAGSAAHHDFLYELETSGLAWRVTLVDASVQGPSAELELVAALRTLATAEVDVVALVRGGGARTDLAAFDGEQLARAIADLPVPVVTGIGHETDRSVADLVAARAAKTPTACAALLVRDVVAARDRAHDAWTAIAARAGRDLDEGHRHLDRLATRMSHAGQRHLDRRAATLERHAERIARAARQVPTGAARRVEELGYAVASGSRRRLDRAAVEVVDRQHRLVVGAPRAMRHRTIELDALAARVGSADPARLLARGWALVRTAEGTPVTSVHDVEPGTKLVTTVADGAVRSTVDPTSEEDQ
jgi:exodeoxyribonuclease VII large subunit